MTFSRNKEWFRIKCSRKAGERESVRRWCETRQQCPQSIGLYRFIEHWQVLGAHQRADIVASVSRDNSRWNVPPQGTANRVNGFATRCIMIEMKVRKNHIGLQTCCQHGQGPCLAIGRKHVAPPSFQNSSHALQYRRLVVDHHDGQAIEVSRNAAHGPWLARQGFGNLMFERYGDFEFRATAWPGRNPDAVTQYPNHPLNNRKPQAYTLAAASALWKKLMKFGEDILQFVGFNPHASIPDFNTEPITALSHSQHHATFPCVAERIAKQITDISRQHSGIGSDRNWPDSEPELQPFTGSNRLEFLAQPPEHGFQVQIGHIRLHCLLVKLGDIQQICKQVLCPLQSPMYLMNHAVLRPR